MAEDRRAWVVVSWVGFAVLLLLLVLFGTDTGISYDEGFQRVYGDYILAWFRSGFTDQSAMHYLDLYLYGGMFDLPAQWIASLSPYDVYETRHFLSGLVAVLGAVATWRLGKLVSGERAGLLGALILALTPCWIGHGMMNPKDIPFATAAAFACVSSLRLAIGPAPMRLRDIVWAAVTVGLALAVRPGGNFVLAYPPMAAGLRIALEIWRRREQGVPLQLGRSTVNLASCVIVVFVLAWLIMLSTWPWAQLDPITRPLEAMWQARHFRWTGTVLFNGKYVDARELPVSYVPTWFKLTLPEIYFLAAAAAGVLLVGVGIRRTAVAGERVLGWIMLAAFVGLPLGAILITRPVLYDAQRHVLFLLPPTAALAGSALSELFAAKWLPRAVRGTFAGVFVGLGLLVIVDIVQMHPFEYTYFNRMSGGIAKNFRRFETDYWGIGYRQGLEYLLSELPPERVTRRTRIVGCDSVGDERLRYYVRTWPGASQRVVVAGDYNKADVLIAVRRWNCHRRPGVTLGMIKRQDTPLIYIRRIQH